MDNESKPIRTLSQISDTIVSCSRCERLVIWRTKVAEEKVKRFRDEDYWGRPLPGFGDSKAPLVVVGLAPAAHGGNRTGRMFTGDESGTWLIRAMHKSGFANQATSDYKGDGLRLTGAYITAAVRCAPPDNRPTPEEFRRCRPYLSAELDLLLPRVIVVLGRMAYDAIRVHYRDKGLDVRPWQFYHGGQIEVPDAHPVTLITSYHPSRQNTQTGRLTQAMLQSVFEQARRVLKPW
jgi:uracil-DNA glycosylase family 4